MPFYKRWANDYPVLCFARMAQIFPLEIYLVQLARQHSIIDERQHRTMKTFPTTART